MTARAVLILMMVAAADATASAAVRPPGAVEVGPAGEGGPLLIDGDHVYWATHDDGGHQTATVRRAPLAGGPAEILARVGELGPIDPKVAVVGGRVFVTQLQRPGRDGRNVRARILRIENGVGRPFAHHRGIASVALVAHDGTLFWVAAGPMGTGPIVATDPRTGRSREIAPCRDPEMDCSDLLPGSPPMVRIFPRAGEGRLHPATRRGLGRSVRAPDDVIAILGDRALCTAEWSGDGDPPPVTLVPLRGGPPVPAGGLDETTRVVAGRYYHVNRDGVVRRDAPGGVDRLLVGGASWFAASPSTLAWIEGGRVWVAPLPP